MYYFTKSLKRPSPNLLKDQVFNRSNMRFNYSHLNFTLSLVVQGGKKGKEEDRSRGKGKECYLPSRCSIV